MNTDQRKKILVVFPGILFPVSGMSQVRTVQQITSLSRSFIVDLFIVAGNDKDLANHQNELGAYCRNIIYAIHPKHRHGISKRILSAIAHRLKYYLTGDPVDHQHLADRKIRRSIYELVKFHRYHMVIAHYWQACSFFSGLPEGVMKAIDTHYVVEENIEIQEKGLYEHNYPFILKRELQYSRKKQNQYFRRSDLLIFNSKKQFEIIRNLFPGKLLNVTPNGQELGQYLEYPLPEPGKTLVFYGALSNQFNVKAIKLLLDQIIPAIREKIPGLVVMFVGNKPPDWLTARDNGNDFIVTGFVEDIRPHISKGYLSIMPLTTASGFRGRTIELMALGVPVIGTHNALDCIEFENGQEGFVTDDVDEMIRISLHLFNHPEERERISMNARSFVNSHYSVDATFGRLTSFIGEVLNK